MRLAGLLLCLLMAMMPMAYAEDTNTPDRLPHDDISQPTEDPATAENGHAQHQHVFRFIESPVISAGDAFPALESLTREPPQTPEHELPHDLSPWGMFAGADIVVKAVMLGLLFASLVTWTILLVKGLELMAKTRRQKRLKKHLLQAASMNDLRLAEKLRKMPVVALVERELELSSNCLNDAEGIKERVGSYLDDTMLENGRRMTTGVGILATIGNTAPFVGLFGTVWGIMNSFIGISESNTTNLAVVAPGIAEALLATALGLVAAIPAVIFYNFFVRRIGVYKGLLGDISGAMLRLLSRELSAQPVSSNTATQK